MQNTLLDNLPISNVDGKEVMSSLDLAKLCYGDKHDKHSHKRFMDKALKVLGNEQVADFCHPRTYSAANNAQRVQQVLHLPQREACLMAMAYSYDLQAKVYDAWVNSTKAHQQVLNAETLEEAQEVSRDVLKERADHIKQLHKQGKGTQRAIFNSLEVYIDDPLEMLVALKHLAKKLPDINKNRVDFWVKNRATVRNLREQYRTQPKKANFNGTTYDAYEKVEHHCTAMIAKLRGKQITKGMNQ